MIKDSLKFVLSLIGKEKKRNYRSIRFGLDYQWLKGKIVWFVNRKQYRRRL